MSSVTHERLDYVARQQSARTNRRAVLQGLLRRAAVMLIGAAIMVSVVAAIIGLKSFVILSRMPAFH